MMETIPSVSIKLRRHLFSKQWLVMLVLFIVFLSYALFLLQGLSFYMYGFDDFHIIYQILQVNFTNLFSRIFFDSMQFYQGFLALGAYQRAVHGLFLKISYTVSGVDPSFYHTLRAIFFALTGILVYHFTKKMIKNEAVSIAAGFLYCSLPVIYDGVRHIGAAEPFSDFFLLLSFYLFITFYDDKANYTGNRRYFYPLIIFLIALFAIKARETSLLLLPAFSVFLLLKYKEYRRNKMWFLVVFFLSLYLVPALFTQFNLGENTEHKTITITSGKVLTNIHNLLLYNPVTRTGNGEQIPVIFSLKQYVSETPGSLLGSLGFFIGWYLIAMLGVYLYSLLKKQTREEVISTNTQNTTAIIPCSDYFTIALLWFIFSILLLMLYVNPGDHSDIRYIGVMALPGILVIIPFCYFMTEYIKKLEIKYLSKYIVVAFLIILFLSVIINAGITGVYRRGGIGSRHKGMEQSAITIFEDLYNQSFDNSYFFAMTEISGAGKYIPCTFSTNISLVDVTVTNDPFLSLVRLITDENIKKSLSNYGFVYIISYRLPASEIPVLANYPTVQLVKEINPCEEGYYCILKNFFKKQLEFLPKLLKEQLNREPKFFVYKIVWDNVSFEKPVKMFCAGEEGLPKNVV